VKERRWRKEGEGRKVMKGMEMKEGRCIKEGGGRKVYEGRWGMKD
jgi:hypothetical protein